MKKVKLGLKIIQHLSEKEIIFKDYYSKNQTGFTLIEVIVVVLMIAILSAIAAPSWMGFINQQRVGKVNDALLQALQDAQREAKRRKLSYSVSFKQEGDIPNVAVYTGSPNPLPWQPLGEKLGIKSGQVLLCSNIGTTPIPQPGLTVCNFDESNKRTLTFDYYGNLPIGSTFGDGLAITAAVPDSSDPTKPLAGAVRCVKVTTLLGSLQTGRGKYDATNNKQGCPLPP